MQIGKNLYVTCVISLSNSAERGLIARESNAHDFIQLWHFMAANGDLVAAEYLCIRNVHLDS